MQFKSYLKALDEHFLQMNMAKYYSAKDSAILQDISNLQQLLNRPEKRISFFGVFKAGKSTVLNALLGEKILPSRTNRATGVITRIGYCEEKKAHVVYRQGNKTTEKYISVEEIGNYILLDVSSAISVAPKDVEAVEIRLPLNLLQNNCYLVDTPGLLDNPTLTERTYLEVEQSDLVVMVLTADKLLSQEELKAIERINHLLNGGIVFLLNRMGNIEPDEKEEVVEWAKSSLGDVGNPFVGRAVVFPTDALTALTHKTNTQQDASDYVDNLLAFESWFKRFHTPIGDRCCIVSRLGILESRLNKALAYFTIQLEARQEKVKNLQQLAQEDLERRQKSFNQTIQQVEINLIQVKSEYLLLGEQLFLQFFDWAKIKVASDTPSWVEAVKKQWQKRGKSYLSQIEEKIKQAVASIEIIIPVLKDTDEVTQILTIQLEEDIATGIGGLFGSSFVLGGSRWLGKTLLGVDLQQENIDNIYKLSKESLLKLNGYLSEYLSKIDSFIASYKTHKKPVLQISEQLIESQKAVGDYKLLIDKLNKFKQETKLVKNKIMSWNDQFNDQWNELIKTVKSQWQEKYSDNKNKQDLNELASKIIQDATNTWNNHNHTHGIWLDNFKREIPALASLFKVELQKVNLQEKLVKPKPINKLEGIVIGVTTIAALLVLFWGQFQSSSQSNRIKLPQVVIAVGLLYGGGYASVKLRKNRLDKHSKNLLIQIENDLNLQKEKLSEIVIKADEYKKK